MRHLHTHTEIPRELRELRELPMFSRLSDRALAHLDRHLDHAHVAAGRVLVREGNFSHETMLILTGQAEVRRGLTSLAMLGPGDWLGEMGSPLGARRSATVTATTPMDLLVCDTGSFLSLVDDPEVARLLLKHLTGRLSETDEQLATALAS